MIKELGRYWDEEENEEVYYYDESLSQIFADTTQTQQIDHDTLHQYAVALNSPWMKTNQKFSIVSNDDEFSGSYWVVTLDVLGYEYSGACILGYGTDPLSAMRDCIKNYDYIQQNYNKEGEWY